MLFISAESGASALQNARRRIMIAKGIPDAALAIRWSFDCPKLTDGKDLGAIRRQLDDWHPDVAIFDPLYLMLLSGTTDVSAANLYQMGPLLRRVADVCLQSGATPILVHHFNRAGAMSTDPPSLENLAFAGIGEFARQWLLINRRQKFEPGSGIHNLWLAVGGSAGQSALFAVDVDEGQMAGDLTGRQWRVVVNSPEDARNSERDERERHRSEQQREQVLHTALRVERYLQRVEGGDSGSKIREEIGVGAPKCQEALEWLIGQHRVEAAMVRRGNGQAYPGYRVAVAPPQEPPPG